MAFAAGSYHGLSYLAETTFGVTPSGTYKNLRHTSCSVALSKDGFQSNELRSDRQISDFRHGAIRVQGDVGIEFSYGEFDALLEAATFGTWSAGGTGGILKAGTTARSFTLRRRFGDILLDGLFTGCMINTFSLSIPANAMVTGSFSFIGKDGQYIGTPHTCTVTVTAGTGAGGAGTVTLTINGTAHTTASIPESSDAETVATAISTKLTTDGITHTRTGAAIALTVNALNGATPTVVFSLGTATGPTATVGTIAAIAPTASLTDSPFDSFSGTLSEGGSPIAVVTSIDLSLANGLEPVFVVGSNTTPKIVPGRSNLTGSLSAYFENRSMLDKFINETESSIELELIDVDGNKYDIEIPRIKYTGADNGVSGEGAIVMNMPWQALYDSNEATNIKITRTDGP